MRVSIFTLVFCFAPHLTAAEPAFIGKMNAVDGDTVSFQTRLLDCDTPETGQRARCDRERDLATKAKNRLKELLSSGKASIEFVQCSCPPENLGTKLCNRGRACGRLFVNAKNVCETLIDEKLARPYDFKWDDRPPRANWCSEPAGR